MKKFEFNKLIRNKLSKRMLEQGVIVNSEKLNPAQYISKLKDKLLEEVREVKEAESVEDLKIELADVLEVIFALFASYGISEEDIEKIKVDKVNINGSFDSNNYVHLY